MSDKTAEQVLKDAAREWVKNDADERGLRAVYVAALRDAGLLRQPHDGDCPVVCERGELRRMLRSAEETIVRLTRERDSHEASAKALDRQRAVAEKERDAALANAITPQEREVIDAAKAWSVDWGKRYVGFRSDAHCALDSALAALAASRKPVEGRRYWTTEKMPHIFGPLGETLYGVNRGHEWHGPFSPEVCHKLVDILNAEER